MKQQYKSIMADWDPNRASPKAEIVRSSRHLTFIRSLQCVKCQIHPCQAAHIRKGTGAGVSMKPSDVYTVPLCPDCHHYQHQVGEVTFWGHKIDKVIELAKRLYAVTGKIPEAHKAIMDYRRG